MVESLFGIFIWTMAAAAAILAAVPDALAQLNTVLTQCGIATVVEQTNLINNEAFTSI
jgi:hypothetical protein